MAMRAVTTVLSGGKALLVLSVILLVAFGGLFYIDGEVKSNSRHLALLTLNAERIQNLDSRSTSAVRLAASLRSDRYIINYQDLQDAKYALLEENLKHLQNDKVRALLAKMEDIQGDLEDAESEAIALIDEEDWENALELVTEPAYRRQKGIYRSHLSAALREMIQQSQRQSDQATMIARAMQIGVLVTFLILGLVGFVYSREMKKSLRRQSDLTASLEDVNENLEQRVSARTAELEENQALLNTLINSLPAVVFLKSPDGRFKLVNRQYELLYGLGQDALYDKSLRDFHPPAVADQLERFDRELIDANEILVREHEISAEGRSVTLNSVMFPVHDRNGALTLFGGIEIDISDRKEAERQLAREKAILDTTLEEMDQGISMYDQELRLVARNQKFIDLIGLPPELLDVGTLMEDALRHNATKGEYGDEDVEEAVRSRMVLAGKFEAHQFERERPDGTVLEIRGNPLPDRAGYVTTYTDVTERKRSEEKITAQTVLLETTLESMDQGITSFDGDLKLVAFNSRAVELYEMPGNPLRVGMAFVDFVRAIAVRGEYGPGDPEELALSRRAAANDFTDARFERARPDGLFLEVRRSMVSTGGFVTTYTDITDRKKASEALAGQSALLETTLESMDQGITMFDENLDLVAYNQRFVDLFQLSTEFFDRGVSFRDLARELARRGEYGPGTPAELAEEVVEKAKTYEAGRFERTRPNGISLDIRRTMVSGGGFVSTFTDITERKLVEAENVKNRRLLDDIFESTPVPLAVIRRSDGVYLKVNPAACDLFGLSEEELLQTYSRDVYVDEEDRAKYFAALDASGKARDIEVNLRHFASGGVRACLLSSFPVVFGDEEANVVAAHDITQRKQMEGELVEAREAAERATEAKAEFLATMSHEIRTPMNGVMSMAEILDQTRLSSDQKSMTGTIRQSAQALLTVINDILDFSKIEAGKLEIEHIAFDMAEVIQSTAGLLAPRAEESSLDLFVDQDFRMPKSLLGDPTRIRQILLNLGSNAIKFTSEGHVTFKVREIARNGGVRIRAEVSDTGIGLTDEQRGKLFQAFAQADTSTSRKFGGTGLGLSICRRLCEMMGGEIGVDSTPGVGSTFWFELVFDVEDRAGRSPTEDLSGARAVLVGYGAVEASILEKTLRAGEIQHVTRAFANLTEYPSLDEALERLEGPPDLVFVNGKPGLHGIGAELSRLDGAAATRGAPIVISAPHGLASTLNARSLASTNLTLLSSVTTPPRTERIWHLVAVALGKAELDQDGLFQEAEIEVFRAPSLEDARRENAVLLVAEDNETNQIVIRRILSRLGFAFEIADDGAQALEMYEDRAFGMLLTDFHMPEMDGFELTAAIRQREAAAGLGDRLPIIALTADALPETEQQCLDAGMDGYLRKPIEMPRLEAALEAGLPQAVALRVIEAAGDSSSEINPVTGEPIEELLARIDKQIFDPARLHDSFGPFDAATAQFVADFIGDLDGRVLELGSALEQETWLVARDVAHAMKGAAASVGAMRMGQIMGDIQDRLDDNDPDTASLFYQLLPETLEELKLTVGPLNQRFLG
jgi:PAS domain S-box-containing protein